MGSNAGWVCDDGNGLQSGFAQPRYHRAAPRERNDMNSPAIDPRLIDALHQASSLELFQLGAVIDLMLRDPRRIAAVRGSLQLGQTVRFFDGRDGALRSGHVLAMANATVTLHETGTRTHWKLPYAAVEPPGGPSAATPAAPQPFKPGRADFDRGDKVSFEDKYLQTQVGTIIRINQQTATIDAGDGRSWRVGFALLRHVHDI